jgi:hypothetical protein
LRLYAKTERNQVGKSGTAIAEICSWRQRLIQDNSRQERRRTMKYSIILAGVAISLLISGCMSGYYTHRERRHVVEQDSLMPPALTVDDVIAMARDSVGDDVILAQMKATHTYYKLTSNDIRDLKKNGVSDKVIRAMIKTADQPETSTQQVVYDRYSYPYPNYYWYPYPSFYDPWYSPAYVGFSFRGGYYGGFRMGGGHGFRGHR